MPPSSFLFLVSSSHSFRMRLIGLAVLRLARLGSAQVTFTLDDVSAQIASFQQDLTNATLSSRSGLLSGCSLAVRPLLEISFANCFVLTVI